MSSLSLIRLGGLVAVLAGVLLLIGDLLSLTIDFENLSKSATTASYAFVFTLYLLGTVLLLVGLVSLYVRQSEAAGVLGLVGFLTAFLGTAMVMGAVWAQLFVAPSLALEAPGFLEAEQVAGPVDLGFTLTFALVAVGWLLFGLATLRARVYPRAAAIVLMVGAVVGFIPVPLSGIVLDVAVAWLGFILFTGRDEAVQQPSRVR